MKSHDAGEAPDAVEHGTPVTTSQTFWHIETDTVELGDYPPEFTYTVVTDGIRSFLCHNPLDADWLFSLLVCIEEKQRKSLP